MQQLDRFLLDTLQSFREAQQQSGLSCAHSRHCWATCSRYIDKVTTRTDRFKAYSSRHHQICNWSRASFYLYIVGWHGRTQITPSHPPKPHVQIDVPTGRGRRRIRVHPETLYTERGSGSWFPRIRLVHSCKAREQVDSVLRIQQQSIIIKSVCQREQQLNTDKAHDSPPSPHSKASQPAVQISLIRNRRLIIKFTQCWCG